MGGIGGADLHDPALRHHAGAVRLIDRPAGPPDAASRSREHEQGWVTGAAMKNPTAAISTPSTVRGPEHIVGTRLTPSRIGDEGPDAEEEWHHKEETPVLCVVMHECSGRGVLDRDRHGATERQKGEMRLT